MKELMDYEQYKTEMLNAYIADMQRCADICEAEGNKAVSRFFAGEAAEAMKELEAIKEEKKMAVTIYCINRGLPSQYFGLKDAEDGTIIPIAPTWKTEAGAKRWAIKHGFSVEGGEKDA